MLTRPRLRRRSRTVLGAATLVLAATLTACSDDPDTPEGDPSANATAAQPSGATTPSEASEPRVDVPPAAKAKTPAGAKAYVAHWVSTLNAAVASGESDRLRELGDGGCGTCVQLADGVDALAEAGGHVTGEGWVLRESAAQPDLPDGKAEIAFTVLRRPEAVEESAGAEPRYFEGGEERYVMALRHDGSTWRATALTPVAR